MRYLYIYNSITRFFYPKYFYKKMSLRKLYLCQMRTYVDMVKAWCRIDFLHAILVGLRNNHIRHKASLQK